MFCLVTGTKRLSIWTVWYLYICILYCCFHCCTEHSAPLFHSITPNFRNVSVQHLGNIIICPNINVVFGLLAALSYHTIYYVVFVVTQREVQPTLMLQWCMGVRKALRGFVLWPALQSWGVTTKRPEGSIQIVSELVVWVYVYQIRTVQVWKRPQRRRHHTIFSQPINQWKNWS